MGRNRIPGEIARLRGNPRKVAQAELSPQPGAADPSSALAGEVTSPSLAASYDCPEFLTHPAELQIFRLIVDEFLPRNLVRQTDFNAYGRYAVLMRLWCQAKHELDDAGARYYTTRSKHGEMIRRHPSFSDLLDLGHELRAMELQLALTPLSRNAIMARMMSAGAGAGLPAPEPSPPEATAEGRLALQDSPLGFLERAATAGEA